MVIRRWRCAAGCSILSAEACGSLAAPYGGAGLSTRTMNISPVIRIAVLALAVTNVHAANITYELSAITYSVNQAGGVPSAPTPYHIDLSGTITADALTGVPQSWDIVESVFSTSTFAQHVSDANSDMVFLCCAYSFFAYDKTSGFIVSGLRWNVPLGSASVIPFANNVNAYDYNSNDHFMSLSGTGTLTLVAGQISPDGTRRLVFARYRYAGTFYPSSLTASSPLAASSAVGRRSRWVTKPADSTGKNCPKPVRQDWRWRCRRPDW